MILRPFQNFLVSLNHTSGRRSWWAAYATGMALILGWVAATLPWIDLFTGSMVGIGQFGGSGSLTTVIVYGNEMPSRVADFYFLAVFLGIAVMKLGLLFVQVGGSFARGYKYQFVPELGILGGRWHR